MNLVSLLAIFGIGLLIFVWVFVRFLHIKNDEGASHARVRVAMGIWVVLGFFIALLAFVFVSDFIEWSRN